MSDTSNLKGNISSCETLEGKIISRVNLDGNVKIPDWLQGPKGDKGDRGDNGERGESGVEIDTQEPTDEEVRVWINPDGSADVNIATEEYVNDAIANIEGGGVNFATFDINSTTGELIMTSDSKITSPTFGLNIDGELEVEFK